MVPALRTTTTLFISLLLFSYCRQLAHAQSTMNDVSSINNTQNLCGTDIPSNVSVIVKGSTFALISWNAVLRSDVKGFEALYWQETSTSYQSMTTDGPNKNISDLNPYTTYRLSVRIVCTNKTTSHASPPISFTTEAAVIERKVTNVTARVSSNFTVNISWHHLQEDQWRGQPFGYSVYIYTHSLSSRCGGEAFKLDSVLVPYPNNFSQTHSLSDGCYRVHVFAINNIAWGPYSDALFFTFTRDPLSLQEVSDPTSESDSETPFLMSPYVYILVSSVIVVVPVVIGIVFFKKAMEKKKEVPLL